MNAPARSRCARWRPLVGLCWTLRGCLPSTDHIVDTQPGRTGTLIPGGDAFLFATREECRKAGIRLFDIDDPDQGIVHVISPELGIVLPGVTLICPDSHTCTQGALGALAWGIGSTDAEHALATGVLRLRRPRTMRITFDGVLPPSVTPKDLMLSLIAAHGAGGGSGHAVEFAGTAVRALDIEGRLTLCNMATEFSAMSGFVAPDEITFAYLEGRRFAPKDEQWDRAVAAWRGLRSDDGAAFNREIAMDASRVGPMVSWGTSPEDAVAVDAAVPAGKDAGAGLYGAFAGHSACRHADRRGLYRQLHQLPAFRLASRRRLRSGSPRRAGCAGGRRARFVRRPSRSGGRRPRPCLRRGRLRVADERLLLVLRCRRAGLPARSPRHLLDQS